MLEVSVSLSVSLSVCHAAELGFTVQNGQTDHNAVWGEDSLGAWDIVLGSCSPTERGRGTHFLNFGTRLVSQKRLKLQT